MENQNDSESPWKQVNEFSWNHQSGWTITRYSVNSVKTYLLWDTRGQAHGPFHSAKEAQAEFDRQPRVDAATEEAGDITQNEPDLT
jgi:hypothetical protein